MRKTPLVVKLKLVEALYVSRVSTRYNQGIIGPTETEIWQIFSRMFVALKMLRVVHSYLEWNNC